MLAIVRDRLCSISTTVLTRPRFVLPEMDRPVHFLPSPLPTESDEPLQWTASPVRLLAYDIALFFRLSPILPNLLRPVFSYKSGPLDELFPSVANIISVAVHIFLIIYQSLFVASLIPLFVWLPVWIAAVCIGLALYINQAICDLFLNGPDRTLKSKVHVSRNPAYESEFWTFVNGVAVGHHWLQANIDRLALTFGREVTGVHNPTSGIIFDIIQCLIERNFTYATRDVRSSYALVKSALLSPRHKKVIFILHSQGGIEGSLVLDWLLAELPREVLRKLEVYTFGNAANHFNNPRWSLTEDRHAKVISHIEHYANTGDFVAQWGVSNFIRLPNRYMGRLFERQGNGHLLTQHYLDYMFPLNREGTACANSNAFMDSVIEVSDPEDNHLTPKRRFLDGTAEYDSSAFVNVDSPRKTSFINVDSPRKTTSFWNYDDDYHNDNDDKGAQQQGQRRGQVQEGTRERRRSESLKQRVKLFSRLWGYRNGMLPFDAPSIALGQDISAEQAVGMRNKVWRKGSGHARKAGSMG